MRRFNVFGYQRTRLALNTVILYILACSRPAGLNSEGNSVCKAVDFQSSGRFFESVQRLRWKERFGGIDRGVSRHSIPNVTADPVRMRAANGATGYSRKCAVIVGRSR